MSEFKDVHGTPFTVRDDADPYWHERRDEPVVILDGAGLPLLLDPDTAEKVALALLKESRSALKAAIRQAVMQRPNGKDVR